MLSVEEETSEDESQSIYRFGCRAVSHDGRAPFEQAVERPRRAFALRGWLDPEGVVRVGDRVRREMVGELGAQDIGQLLGIRANTNGNRAEPERDGCRPT